MTESENATAPDPRDADSAAASSTTAGDPGLTWTTRPLFVSSTFADLHDERDELRVHAFAVLEEPVAVSAPGYVSSNSAELVRTACQPVKKTAACRTARLPL